MRRVEDKDRQKQAIHNAFRVALLSVPDKSLHDVATHYQDMMHVHHSVDDPKVYYDTLESARINHNRAIGISNPELYHKPHFKALNEFYSYYHSTHPNLSPSEAREAADREVHIFQYEIEDKLHREKPDKPVEEKEIFKQLERKLKNFVKPHKEAASKEMAEHPGTYKGFHQTSMRGIAGLSKHLNKIYDIAKEDIAQGGKGYHFRDKVLDLNIKHVGPKEISLAWHLLAPNTSELAYVDHALLDALGYKPKDYKVRDYGLYERMLMAARDSTGYHHMPLSLFQKGLMDQYRGAVSHETLAVHDPVRVHHAEWKPKPAPHIWPAWWDETKPYRESVKKEWNKNEGKNNPPQTVVARLVSTTRKNSGRLGWLSLELGNLRLDTSYIHSDTNYSGTPVEIVMDDEIITAKSDCWAYVQRWKANESYPKGRYSVRISPYKFSMMPSPNLDNEINDPLANDGGDPMPSWEMLNDHPCEVCQGEKVIMLNGKKQACPSCSGWKDKMIFDNEPVLDPAIDNPAPGIHDPAIDSSGP